MFRNHDQKLKAIITKAPLNPTDLTRWIENCTPSMRQDLFKYCTKMSKVSEATKEKAKIIKFILKYLPSLENSENADRFLLETSSDDQFHTKLWNRLETYPLDTLDFNHVYLKIQKFQDCYIPIDKFALILKKLSEVEELRNHSGYKK